MPRDISGRKRDYLAEWATAVVECGASCGDWWDLLPCESAALELARARKAQRETRERANLLSAITGLTPEEHLPEGTEDEDSPEAIAREHARLAAYLERHATPPDGHRL